MNKIKLHPIPESISTSESDNQDKIAVEIIYYPDTLPTLKSYYLLSYDEYNDLLKIHRDLYIENFINNEKLTKDKLDIHIIQNDDNIILCKNFIKIFGNTFDILNYINNIKISNDDLDINNFIINDDKFSDDSEISSENNLIDTITDIIDIYNKSNQIDNRINNILIKDDIIDELKNQNKSCI